MIASEISKKHEKELKREEKTQKPFFRPAKDDSKPLLQDPILRSDPIETEEAVLRLPPLPDCINSKLRPE
ncbi:hypothetical protein CASFOL_005509 [Castilleja foliolosa]|uniref:Uncharacterized protein n=1 Tax=Castilleja foliolosa TaxID=1961234 RepID=A0ABD3E7Q7_9LAMI